MNKFTSLFLLIACGSSIAPAQEIQMLDLTKAATPLEFNADNGAWDQTYNADIRLIESQCFNFIHYGFEAYGMWWGFTPSVSADNSRKDDTITYQFSNMAAGGIVLNEDGTVKKDEFGDPMVSADVPYLVGYYAGFMSERPCDMLFADGECWEPQGVYVNLTSYPYYCMEMGDAYARAFRNGDSYKLTITGVAADESQKNVVVELGGCSNGHLSLTRGWRFVDLTPLGAVNEIFFNLSTTDVGDWGDNTPTYFALDKLSAKKSDSSVKRIQSDVKISFNREDNIVSAGGADFIAVYDLAGRLVASSEGSLCIEALPAGVYMVKAGNSSLKIVK